MDKDKLNKKIETFLSNDKKENENLEQECQDEICLMNNSDDIIIRKENKIFITNDGRQLLT